MTNTIHTTAQTKMNCKRFTLAAALAAAVFGACGGAQQAAAQIDVNATFTMDIGSSARLLDAMGTSSFDAIWHQESCDSPLIRLRSLNRPAIKLAVDPLSTLPLESFTMTINEGPYLFGSGDFNWDHFDDFIMATPYASDGVSITGSSLSTDMKSITVFFDGLTAGKNVIFHVDLDATSGYAFPDFRAVLNGAPLTSTSTPTDPASISAIFGSGADAETKSATLPQLTTTPEMLNQARPYHEMVMVPDPGPLGDDVVPLLMGGQKIDFGTVAASTMSTLADIASLKNIGDAGTAINLLTATITGTNASLFSILDFSTANQLLAGAAATAFDVKFAGAPNPGMYTATLTIATSHGNAVYDIMAVVPAVPEPATLTTLAMASLCLAGTARRRLS